MVPVTPGTHGADAPSRDLFPSSDSGSPSSSPTATSIGCSPSQVATDAAKLSTIVTGFIFDRFKMDEAKRLDMETQLTSYFRGAGVENDSIFSIMTDQDRWPSPDSSLPLLTLPVIVLLSQLASHTALVLGNDYYLAQGMQYKSLASYAAAMNHPVRHDARGSDSSIATSRDPNSTVPKAIPKFKVPPFKGDAYDGKDFLRKAAESFRSAGVHRFIESEDAYDEE